MLEAGDDEPGAALGVGGGDGRADRAAVGAGDLRHGGGWDTDAQVQPVAVTAADLDVARRRAVRSGRGDGRLEGGGHGGHGVAAPAPSPAGSTATVASGSGTPVTTAA